MMHHHARKKKAKSQQSIIHYSTHLPFLFVPRACVICVRESIESSIVFGLVETENNNTSQDAKRKQQQRAPRPPAGLSSRDVNDQPVCGTYKATEIQYEI